MRPSIDPAAQRGTQHPESGGSQIRTFAAAILALLAVATPAHAAVLNLVDEVDLIFPTRGELTGAVEFTYSGFPGTGNAPYFVTSVYIDSLKLNGTPYPFEVSVPPGIDVCRLHWGD